MKTRTRPQANQRCPLCHSPLADRDRLVACRGCRTPYHRDCLSELGGCSTLGCARQRQAPSQPELPPTAEELQTRLDAAVRAVEREELAQKTRRQLLKQVALVWSVAAIGVAACLISVGLPVWLSVLLGIAGGPLAVKLHELVPFLTWWQRRRLFW